MAPLRHPDRHGIGAEFAKRFGAASLTIRRSPLAKVTQMNSANRPALIVHLQGGAYEPGTFDWGDAGRAQPISTLSSSPASSAAASS
ncbi:hypothetical protein [Amycolatopsis sp. lyj-23]|uniref:hypothetical protein n=1 Tax=Amycolatopsis sp. lyj-23 TaxID=2789283 RepID=UPI00397CB544